jgi:glycosyltransferase involved in cell wall biosynthesis
VNRPTAVLSYFDVSELRNGRSLRVNALLEAAGPGVRLFQPRVNHPRVETVAYPVDLGRRKIGINWGIFNLYHPVNRARVRRALAAQPPRLVWLTSIWDLPALNTPPGTPVLFDSHNVDAVYMEQRYGRGHPFVRLVERAERRTLARADHVFVCSAADGELYRARYGVPSEKITVAPNGVDTARFDRSGPPPPLPPALAAELAGRTVLFFMGKLDYPPNAEALRFLAERLLPELEARQPGRFVALVTGTPVPATSPHPNLRFAGLVPDLARYLARADLCLAPLFVGSGTRLKILDYLAAGRPVIATPIGIEGIHARPGVEAVIDSADRFADHILRLADAPEEREQIARAGQAFVRAHFDWRNIRPLWQAVSDRLCAPE